MSKRQRVVKERKQRVVEKEGRLELPPEIWFLIGGYLQWHDVETLVRFVCVSKSAIRFVQPPIRVLVQKLIAGDGNTHELPVTWKEYMHETNKCYLFKRLDKSLLLYYSTKEATLEQWREWSVSILSVLYLSELRKRYLIQKKKTRDSHWRSNPPYRYISRVCTTKQPTETTKVCKVFYHDPGTTEALRIDKMRVTRVVNEWPTDLWANAQDTAKSKPTAMKEFQMLALQKATTQHGRALTYYLLEDKLSIRLPKENDLFGNVLLVNPKENESRYIHIYSLFNGFANHFIQSCIIYTGKDKDAPNALHLHVNADRFQQLCVKKCERLVSVLKSIKK